MGLMSLKCPRCPNPSWYIQTKFGLLCKTCYMRANGKPEWMIKYECPEREKYEAPR